MCVLNQQGLTTGVHLDIADDTIDVKAGEGEDLGELAIVLQLDLQEEDFTLTGADVTIGSHNVASLIDHEAGLVDVDLIATVIAAE